MYRSIYTYPWDIYSNEIEKSYNYIKELGLDTITLAASYHAGKFVSHKNKGRVVFPEDGTVYFDAIQDKYGKIKPLKSSLLDSNPDLFSLHSKIKSSIQLNPWVVLLHNTRIGMSNPECVVRNVYNDPYWYSLCPNNPDVIEYAVSICCDLAENEAVKTITIESPGFLPFHHGFHHEFSQTQQNYWIDSLLALCFCKNCKSASESANIDFEDLKNFIVINLEKFFKTKLELDDKRALHWFLGDVVENNDLRSFIKVRSKSVCFLIDSIRSALPDSVKLSVIPTINKPHSMAFLEGTNLREIEKNCDFLELPLYENSLELRMADLWDCLRKIDDINKIRCILRPGLPDMNKPQELFQTLKGINEFGIKNLAFYNYGLLPEKNLLYISDALKKMDIGNG